jgi:diguanylate cyclase (GGDEF)-like protein
MGGDEFAILIEDGGEAAGVAAKILSALTQPVTVGRHLVPLAVSIGIAELNPADPPVEPGVLLHHADAAMYEAKRLGKAQLRNWADRPAESSRETTSPSIGQAPLQA